MNQHKTKQVRRYRLNKKRFATVLLLVGIITALIVIVTTALGVQALDALVMAPGLEGPFDTSGADGRSSDTLKGRLIVLDAGHGGFDPGAIGISGAREDELALAITQCLKNEFESHGAKVIMTREDDRALADVKEEDMAERRRIIVESGSDIVVSIHLNSYDDPKVSGPLVLFMPGSEKGKQLADAVQHSMNAALEGSGSARSDNLYILRSGNQPCILVECGYISNKEEERKLRQPDYQRKVAKAICDGVGDYFSKLV